MTVVVLRLKFCHQLILYQGIGAFVENDTAASRESEGDGIGKRSRPGDPVLPPSPVFFSLGLPNIVFWALVLACGTRPATQLKRNSLVVLSSVVVLFLAKTSSLPTSAIQRLSSSVSPMPTFVSCPITGMPIPNPLGKAVKAKESIVAPELKMTSQNS